MKALLIKLATAGNWQQVFRRRISDVFTLRISITMLSQQVSAIISSFFSTTPKTLQLIA